jgi:hypothetical protein
VKQLAKVFAPTDSITITKFGASSTPAASCDWISHKDLPPLSTVGNVIPFLDNNDQLGPIDFSATLGDGSRLSIHDDGEANFLFSDKADAIDALHTLLKKDASPDDADTILGNPGKFVWLKNGEAQIFSTFEEYLKKTRRRV